MTPSVSVVIPTYNGAARLPLQLEALVAQRDAPPFEVIVVDNGSTDGSAEIARSFADRLDVAVLRADSERGTSYARNRGIAFARADVVAFCDDDDCVSERWVASALRSVESHEFVTGQVTDVDASRFSSVSAVRSLVPEPSDFQQPHPVAGFDRYPILMGGNSAARKSVLLDLHGFDQRFFPGAEDNDLGLRFVEAGGELWRAPSMVVAARVRATTTGVARRNFNGGRRHMLLCEVHRLWDASPNISAPDFRLDLVRALAALITLPIRRQRDARGVLGRLGLRAGQLTGWIDFHLLRRVPPARLGVGLEL